MEGYITLPLSFLFSPDKDSTLQILLNKMFPWSHYQVLYAIVPAKRQILNYSSLYI